MSYPSSTKCSACGAGKCKLTSHPLLEVPVCEDCSAVYQGEFTIDEVTGNEIYCRWCGEGQGSISLCDSCPKSFCSGCIQRNFGLAEITRIQGLSERWSCFLCSPQSLEDLCENNGWNIEPSSSSSTGLKKKRKFSNNPNIVCPDISRGRERFPIPAYNDVDHMPAPLDFTYVTKHVAGDGVVISNNPSFVSCCTCTDNCKDASKCECARLMGGFAYNKNGIYLVEKAEGIYECNQRCQCHVMRCKNRVVGKGPHLKLEVFRCSDPNKGWGVRCLTAIPAGTYITDYLGEVMLESHADGRGLSRSDEYLYNLDAWGRSQACQKLSELGMKKGLLSIPKEHEVDVSALSKNEVYNLLGSELTELLDSKGALDRAVALGNEQLSGASGAMCKPCKSSKSSKVITAPSIVLPSSSSSSSAAASSNAGVESVSTTTSWWQSRRVSRLQAWKNATDTISDRAITETEENNDTFTVDARCASSHQVHKSFLHLHCDTIF
jgi:Pre-SET motif